MLNQKSGEISDAQLMQEQQQEKFPKKISELRTILKVTKKNFFFSNI